MSSWWCAPAHLRFHGFVGIGIHDGVILSVPPVPAKLPHISFHVLNGTCLGALPSQRWWGASPGSDDLEPTLGPGDIAFVGRTNDAGFIVPHVSIPPNNSQLPLTILFGGSMSMLGASSVNMMTHNMIFQNSEADVACCWFPAPVSINLGCSDPVPLPGDFVISPCTVEVGVQGADVLAAAVDIAIEYAMCGLEAVGGRAVKKIKSKVKARRAGKAGGDAASTVREEAQEAATESMRESLSKRVIDRKVEVRGHTAEVQLDLARPGAMKPGSAAREAASDEARRQADEVIGAAQRRVDSNSAEIERLTDGANARNVELQRDLDELADQRRQLDDLDLRQADLEAERARLDEVAPDVYGRFDTAEARFEASDRELREQQNLVDRNASDIEAAREREEDLAVEMGEKVARRNDAEKRGDELALTRAQSEVNRVQGELTDQQQRVRELEESAPALSASLDRAKRQADEDAASLELATRDREAHEVAVEDLSEREQHLAGDRAGLGFDAGDLDAREAELDGTAARYETRARGDAREISGLWNTNRDLRRQIEEAREWVDNLESATRWENFKTVWSPGGDAPGRPNFFRPIFDDDGALSPALGLIKGFAFNAFKFFVSPGGGFGAIPGRGTDRHPIPTITSDEPSPTACAPFRVRVSFDRPVLVSARGLNADGFTANYAEFTDDCIDVDGGSASDLTPANVTRDEDNNEFASEFTFELTPAGEGEVAVTLESAAAYHHDPEDGADFWLPSVATDEPYRHRIDATPPRVLRITTAASAPSLATPITFETDFSEEVDGLSETAISASNAQIRNIHQLTDRRWSFECFAVRPAGGSGPGEVTAAILVDGFSDSAGNRNTAEDCGGASHTFALAGPTVTVMAPNADTRGAPFEVTVEFSAPVRGFDASSVVIVSRNATPGDAVPASEPVAGSDGLEYVSSYRMLVSPQAGLDGEEVRLQVPADVATDETGGRNTLAADLVVRVDNVAPRIESVRSRQGDPTRASRLPVTIRFSEPVKGLVPGDLAVANATVASLGPGATTSTYEYILTLTPDEGLDGQVVSVDVGEGVVTDAVGNGSEGTARFEITVDNVGAEVESLSTDASSPATSGVVEVTVTFSRPIRTWSFDVCDIVSLDGGLVVGNSVAARGSETDFAGNVVASSFTFELAPPAGDGEITVGARVGPGAGEDGLGNLTTGSAEIRHAFDRGAGYTPPPDVTLPGRGGDPGFYDQYCETMRQMSPETQEVVDAQGAPSTDGSEGTFPAADPGT